MVKTKYKAKHEINSKETVILLMFKFEFLLFSTMCKTHLRSKNMSAKKKFYLYEKI